MKNTETVELTDTELSLATGGHSTHRRDERGWRGDEDRRWRRNDDWWWFRDEDHRRHEERRWR
jgi:hypothetical protein